jgi:hypothetical protein
MVNYYSLCGTVPHSNCLQPFPATEETYKARLTASDCKKKLSSIT